MSREIMIINLVYIVAAILFVFGIKMLGSAKTARNGNLLSSVGMLIAIVATLFDRGIVSYEWIIIGVVIGTLIGAFAANFVKMTAMPEMVALFNGFGGLASLLVGWTEYEKIRYLGWGTYLSNAFSTTAMDASKALDLYGEHVHFVLVATYLAVLIGGVTFTGSVYAWGKLSGNMPTRPILFVGQKFFNLVTVVLLLVGLCFFGFTFSISLGYLLLLAAIILSLVLGFLGVMPIGGGDMPVVISLLNSFSGLAACAAGFVIGNNVLIVAGCLVGTSGLILTVIMCKAMNRTLRNVLFSGFGASGGKGSAQREGELKPITIEDAYYVLEAANDVVIVPGYGMAVAQAQHAVKELGELLEDNDCTVRYAIHPVAGRMPGHMNVLLAEADVPYEQLSEMNDVNPTMERVDVAIVIGANDVVNPAALEEKGSPIYGMPIINVHKARTVFVLKRGKGTGFSGLENALFTMPNTRMLYGDAKASVSGLVAQFKG